MIDPRFVYLAIVLPGLQLRASLRGRKPERSRLRRYAGNSLHILILLALLALDWRWTERSWAALGVGIPVGTRGLFGLAGDGLLAYRAIRTGRTDAGLVEVLDGLKPGERIVTKGGLFIDQVAVPASS